MHAREIIVQFAMRRRAVYQVFFFFFRFQDDGSLSRIRRWQGREMVEDDSIHNRDIVRRVAVFCISMYT